jgi:hypothetical protein
MTAAVIIACSDTLESAFMCTNSALDITWAGSPGGEAAQAIVGLFGDAELSSRGGKGRSSMEPSTAMSSTASLPLCLARFAEGGVRRKLLGVASSSPSPSAHRARFRGEGIAMANA